MPQEASDERRRALHAAAVVGQMTSSNAPNTDRDQSHDGEQIDQCGGPEYEAGVHGLPFKNELTAVYP